MKQTILLVEDDFLNRRLSKKTLLENNFKVLEAKNAKEALDVLKKESVNLAILDINLGENEQNGISLGLEIKEKFNVPFIYLTAYENVNIINDAVATAPYSYLIKPFKTIDLITAVQIAIRQSKAAHVPKLLVKEGEYTVELPISEIDFIVSEGNYLLFYANRKTYKLRSTIKLITKQLSKNIFLQVHRAYVVNKLKIEKFNPKSVVVTNVEIPTSRHYLDNKLR